MTAPIRVVMVGPALEVPGGIASVERMLLGHVPVGIEVTHIPTMRGTSRKGKIRAFLGGVWKLWRCLRQNRCDVVHVHFASRGSTFRKWVVAALALAARRPVVLHAHGGGFPEFYGALPRPVQRCIAGTFRRCHRLLALSDGWADYYRHSLGLHHEQVVVMPNPVVLPAARRRTHEAGPMTVLYLGGAFVEKGCLDLLQAVAEMDPEMRDGIRWVMAGGGDGQWLAEQAVAMGVDRSVQWRGWLSPEARDQALAGADVLVLPSHLEALPMVMLEAMAYGLAVVATPVGAIPDFITHERSGWLVEVGDAPGMGQALSYLAQHPELREAMGRGARQRVSACDVATYWQQLATIYAAATGQKGGAGIARRSRHRRVGQASGAD